MFIYLCGWSLHMKNSTSFNFVHEFELLKLSSYYWIRETVNEVHGLVNPFPCHQAHPFHNRPKSLAEIPISGYPTDRNQAQHFSSLCFYTWPSQLVAAGGEFRSWYGDSSFSSFDSYDEHKQRRKEQKRKRKQEREDLELRNQKVSSLFWVVNHMN